MAAPRKRFDSRAVEDFLSTGGGVLEGTVPSEADVPDPFPGRTVGAYRIVERVGRGGMSTVYRGERADGQFEQSVAVKLLSVASDRWLERFQREREILAGLEHPHIARILDAGLLDEHQPYLVMELVSGRPLDRYCDEAGGPVRERLDLFLQIARAVQYAHGHLVVHRDLKPANVLVTDDGQAKLLDFGIARVLEEDTGSPTTTLEMTPRYATPEQVEGGAFTVASDVYQLGLILYRMLTGVDAQKIEGLSQLSEVVCKDSPVSPGRRARERGVDLGAPWSRDLDAIVLQCLRKEPANRYATVQALIDDLEAHRDRRPVRARAGGGLYELGCFVRRHRVGVLAGAVALLSLVTALIISSVSLVRTRTAEQEAQRELTDGRAVLEYMVSLFEVNDPSAENLSGITARDLLERGARSIEQDLADQPARRATLMDAMGRALAGLADFPAAERMLAEARRLRREQFGDGDAKVVDTSIALAETLHAVERFAEAEALLRPCLQARREALGGDHPLTMAAQAALARTLSSMGQYDEAEQLYRPVVTAARRSTELSPVELAATLTEWGDFLTELGRLHEVEELHWEAIDLLESALGATHLLTSQAYVRLGGYYTMLEDLVRAEELFHRGLQWVESFEGPHPHSENCQRALGLCLIGMDREAEAVPYLEQALEQCRSLYGEDHARTGLTRNYLGRALRNLQQLEAAPHIEEGLVLIRRHLGADHPRMIDAWEDLSFLRVAQDREWEATLALEKARGLALARLGPEHPRLAMILGNLALRYFRAEDYSLSFEEARRADRILASVATATEAHSHCALRVALAAEILGDIPGAIEAARRAVTADLRRADGLSELDRGVSQTYLARILRNAGELVEAEVLLREAYEHYRDERGPDHGSTYLARHELNLIAERQGRLEEALAGTREVVDLVEPSLGHDPRFHVLRLDLARLLVRVGKMDEAEPLYRAALLAFRGSKQQPRYWVGVTLRDYADLLCRRGQAARARFVATQALCALTARLPAESPDVLGARSVLGMAMALDGEPEAGLAVLREAHETLSKSTGAGSRWTADAARRLDRYQSSQVR